MTETELQALALLTGGKIWEGQLLLPRKESSARELCTKCALRNEHFKTCVTFLHGPRYSGSTGCSSTAITWHPYQPPKE